MVLRRGAEDCRRVGLKKTIRAILGNIRLRKLPLRLLLPGLFLTLTIVFGGFAAGTGAGFWKATGLLIGETSYQTIDEFAQLDGRAGADERPVAREFSAWPRACLWAARLFGMAFILSTLNVLMLEQIREPVRRLRVWRWWVSSWLWHFVVERCLRRAGSEVRWDYVLICGLGWKGREIALKLREKGRKVSVIEKDLENASIETVKLTGAKVFIGDATDAELLRKAGARHAREIYVVSANDEVDCRIVQQLASLLKKRDKLPCEDNDTFDMAKCRKCKAQKAVRIYAGVEGYRSRIFLENREWNAPMHVSCFNMEELIAREQFRRSVWPRLAVAGRRHMAFHIFGWTPIAREVLLHVQRSAHLYKGQDRQVVVFCEEPEKREREFLEAYPCLERDEELMTDAMRKATAGVFPSLSFEPLPRANAGLLAGNLALYKYIQPGWQTHAFYCIDDGVKSEAIASLVQPRLQWFVEGVNNGEGEKTEVYSHVYYNYPEDDSGATRDESEPERFGAYTEFCNPEGITKPLVERHARAVAAFFHALYPKPPGGTRGMSKAERKTASGIERDKIVELYRARHPRAGEYCVACYMQRVWEWSAEWERESSRQAADHVPVKLALHGLVMDQEGDIDWANNREEDPIAHLKSITHSEKRGDGSMADPEALVALAEMEHRRWCAERLLGGWLPLSTDLEWQGWESDKTRMKEDLRLHRDLVPFDDLPNDEKDKDYEIIRAIPYLGKSIHEVAQHALGPNPAKDAGDTGAEQAAG